MKRLKNIASLIVILLLSLTSCDKIDKNGDLDGMWQCQNYSDMIEGGKPYLSIQLDLLNIRYADMNIYARFEHNGNTLRIYNAYSALNDIDTPFSEANEYGDENQAHAFKCRWFLNSLLGTNEVGEATLNIKSLTSKQMVLEVGEKELKFRKY
ncbi:MAG: lipocalin-like domain-containing protein [Bacteroidaceae bacterium]|nr:lipocalin-like domain-containing protein [Bacteroidaceae bacterium]